MASASDSGRSTSPTIGSTSPRHGLPCNREASRARHRTRVPVSSSLGTSRPPMYPVTPVTSTGRSLNWAFGKFMARGWRLSVMAGSHLQADHHLITAQEDGCPRRVVIGKDGVAFFRNLLRAQPRLEFLDGRLFVLRRAPAAEAHHRESRRIDLAQTDAVSGWLRHTFLHGFLRHDEAHRLFVFSGVDQDRRRHRDLFRFRVTAGDKPEQLPEAAVHFTIVHRYRGQGECRVVADFKWRVSADDFITRSFGRRAGSGHEPKNPERDGHHYGEDKRHFVAFIGWV